MAFSLETSTAQLRGELVPFDQANVSIASSPVLYGLSVYTVFPLSWDASEQRLLAFRLQDHYLRLVRASKIMGFGACEALASYDAFESLIIQLAKANAPQEDVLIRATVFIDEICAGTKISGLKTNFSAFMYPKGEILKRSGIDVCVSSWTRNADNMIPPRAKVNGAYVNSALMKNEALLNGFDDAIALDNSGHVAEGTVTNLFIVRDGRLVTPHAQTDILEGITRNTVQAIAQKLGIPFEDRTIDRTELYIADEVMMVGSSANVTPVLSIDRRPIANGRVGEITHRIAEAYEKLLHGTSADFAGWLRHIPAKD